MRQNFQQLGRSHAMGHRAMVCTSHPLATAAAHRAFLRGGNAMDAALTAVIVQGVVEPAMTGLGGDCFCLIGDGDGQVTAFNGSGATAKRAQLADLQGRAITMTDAAAITVPGAVDAWAQLHRAHGSLPWAELFTDAIAYARDGFAVHERVAQDWATAQPALSASPSAAPVYLDIDGQAPGPGTTWRLPALAKTLECLAQEGPRAFYHGELAQAMVAHCQALGGVHSPKDFAAHQGIWVSPLSTPYGDHQIYGCPPNGQGLVALLAFAILAAARAQGLETSGDPFDPDRVEWQLRALCAGYEVRDRFIADPRLSEGLAEACLAPDHIAVLVREIAEQKAARTRLYAAAYSPPHRDTVYVAARDASGLSVSLINSLFNAFGSTHVAGDTGILLHSRGLSFTPQPGHPNAYGPEKRPMHTIIPALALKHGQVDRVFGVMGGHYQPQGQVHIFTAMQDCGLSPQAAQDLPRWFANPAGFVEVEERVPDDLINELIKRVGDVRPAAAPLGGSQVIQVQGPLMLGATDPRKDGLALGV